MATQFLIYYQTFLDWLEKTSYFIAMTLLALLFINTTGGILVNIFIGNSLVWAEEISILLFAWVCFLGAGIISRRGGHIGVEMLYDYLGPKYQIYLRFFYLIMALIVVAVMVYFGTKMAFFVGKYQKSLYLDINLFYFYASIPVGGLIMGLNSIGAFLPDPRSPQPQTDSTEV